MEVIYKVKSYEVITLYKDKDFIEEHFKIIFNGKSIYKVQFGEVLIQLNEGFVIFTDCKENIPELQSILISLEKRWC